MAASVRSNAGLTDDLAKRFDERPQARRFFAPGFAGEPMRRRRAAIFAIHGISPTQRYAFGDQVAGGVQCMLNAIERRSLKPMAWKTVVHWPFVGGSAEASSAGVRPTALRVYRMGDDPLDPKGTTYDVYEGYWSPLSKGKTNIASAMRWILNATFLATSSTANLPCDAKKLRFDLTYVGRLLAVIVGIAIAALGIGLFAWTRFAALLSPLKHQPGFLHALSSPVAAALSLPLRGYLELALDLLAAYVVAQLVVIARVRAARQARHDELLRDAHDNRGHFAKAVESADVFHRATARLLWWALAVLIVAAVGVGAWTLSGPFNLGRDLWFAFDAALVALSMLAFQAARYAADFAVDDVLGDIQIYTTHDENSAFFGIRQQIVQSVTDALLGVLRAVDPPCASEEAPEPPPPYYDEIHLMGHSLGCTVGMDALILLRHMVQEGAISEAQWGRIRSFTTFGTALEKTRFFFDVRHPTVSAAQDQWQDDVYGRFFTDDIKTLEAAGNGHGIYWSNLWYFHDVVANEIVSYTSDVPTGAGFVWSGKPRAICKNERLPHDRPVSAWVHGDYLADECFWEAVAPVLT